MNGESNQTEKNEDEVPSSPKTATTLQSNGHPAARPSPPHISLYGVSADVMTKPPIKLPSKSPEQQQQPQQIGQPVPMSRRLITTNNTNQPLISPRPISGHHVNANTTISSYNERPTTAAVNKSSSSSGLPTIGYGTRTNSKPLLASQPAAPIVLSTKQQQHRTSGSSETSNSNSEVKFSLEASLRQLRFNAASKTATGGGSTSTNHSPSTTTASTDPNASLSSYFNFPPTTPKLSTTVNATSGFAKILTNIRTEPNLQQALKRENNLHHHAESDAGVTIPTTQRNNNNNTMGNSHFMRHVDSSSSSQQSLGGPTQLDRSLSLSSQSHQPNSRTRSRSKQLLDDPVFGMSREERETLLREFELTTTLGTGTFGRVMLVKSSSLDRVFALKLMSIVDMHKRKQVQHVKNEKAILENVRAHPFLVTLYWTHRDRKFLYLLFEYVPGGELFTRLRQKGRFETKTAVFYSSEIVCALEFLHSKSIVYRDLKPENILLDKQGHIKLTDMGFAKKCHDKTFTLCGTPEYLAPEVISNRGHNFTCDWWSLGIIVFEFLSGSPPFYDENRDIIYQKILAGKIEWPVHIDSSAKDLIRRLLVPDPTKRLGSGNCGVIRPGMYSQPSYLQSPPPPHSPTNLPAIKNNNNNTSQTSPTVRLVDDSTSATPNGVNGESGTSGGGFFVTEIVELVPVSEPTSATQTPPSYNSPTLRKDTSSSIFNTSLNGSLGRTGGPNGGDQMSLKKQKIHMGSEEVKQHKWFIGTNWSDVYMRKLKPPFVPDLAHEADTQHFEKYDPTDLTKIPTASNDQYDHFKDF